MSRPWAPRDRHDDEELPPLPPLDDDGEEGEPSLDDVAIVDSEREAADDEEAAGGEEFDLEAGPESGLLADSEEAEDVDVGDLADEIAAQDGETWAGDEEATVAEPDDSWTEDAASEMDEGDEGVDEDVLADLELPPREQRDDPADDLSEWDASIEAGDVSPESRVPAFALPSPGRGATAMKIDGIALTAAATSEGVVVAGEVVSLVPNGRFDRTPSARRLARAPTDDPITAMVSLGGRVLLAATSRGAILRSEDGGVRWDDVANLGVADARTPSPIELFAVLRSEGARVWARAHGGGLLSSDDRGEHWEGPVASARACAIDPRSGEGVIVVSAPKLEARPLSGNDRALPLRAVPLALACAGDVWAFAFAAGPGSVSGDGGRTLATCPLLANATALALLETDDGAVQLVAAIHDDATDRSTILRASVARDGTLAGARRIADCAAFGAPADGSEDAQNRIEAIVPLNAEHLLIVSSGGVAVIEAG